MKNTTVDQLGLDFRVVAMVSHMQREPAEVSSQQKQKSKGDSQTEAKTNWP